MSNLSKEDEQFKLFLLENEIDKGIYIIETEKHYGMSLGGSTRWLKLLSKDS